MIYDRYVAAWENLDVEDYLACCHEDYEMTFHSTGKALTLAVLILISLKVGWFHQKVKVSDLFTRMMKF